MKSLTQIFAGTLLITLVAVFTTVAAMAKGPVEFKVRIENISNSDGQTASNSSKWPFALSPGLWVVHTNTAPLFTTGEKDLGRGLEAQTEDGNPASLVKQLERRPGILSVGVFNTPMGASAPGPIVPGGAYEFTFTAAPGGSLSFATMFGQSNDLFYAPIEKGIALFDLKGSPISGDITSKVILWDAGTEVNQEPGIGPDQAPRQSAPNTGAGENGVVKNIKDVKDGFNYPETAEVMRITITPVSMPVQ